MPTLVAALVAAATQTWTFNLGSAPAVSVEDVSGQIQITGEERLDVTVEATKSGGSDEEQAAWTLEVEGRDGKLHARARCARHDPRCRSSSVKVRFVLRVPRASIGKGTARLDVSTVSGDVVFEE